MGYYTNFTLEIINPIHEGQLEEILTKHDNIREAGCFHTNGECCDESKWYSHEEDMRELSRQYPDILFKLYGEGGISDDLWHEYYKNGKMQSCPAIITFDPYDEGKLT